MFWPFKRKPKVPVKVSLRQDSIMIRYKNAEGDFVSVALIVDIAVPGTFVVSCNGIPLGRVWVEDNGVSLGVSDTVGPIKLVS